MMRDRSLCWMLSAVVLLASPAVADRAAPPPQRSANLVVYGSDPCPKGEDGEIVVCASRPEKERYRIPKQFRGQNDKKPTEAAWGSRVAVLDEVNAGARPDSCSVVGSYGQSGCFAQMLRQWHAERQAARSTH